MSHAQSRSVVDAQPHRRHTTTNSYHSALATVAECESPLAEAMALALGKSGGHKNKDVATQALLHTERYVHRGRANLYFNFFNQILKMMGPSYGTVQP